MIGVIAGCGDTNTSSTTTEEPQSLITTDEFFTINSRSKILENHESYLVTEKMTGLDYPCYSYAKGDMYAVSQDTYANVDADHASITFTDGTASEIDFNYCLYVHDGSVTTSDTYGDLLESPDAELTSCTKTEEGYDAQMINHHEGVVKYSSYCCDREYADGDYIRMDIKLNDNYEIIYVGTYYVPADGSEEILFKTEDVKFDPEDVPDFVNNINNTLAGESHIFTYAGPDETKQIIVYGNKLRFETDCEVYTNEKLDTKIEPDEKYMYSIFNFDLEDSLTVFLKYPEE